VVFRANRNQSSFRGSRKRLTEWGICTTPTGFSTVAAGAKVLLVLVPVANLAPESPATIVRSRFILGVRSDQSTATEDLIGAFGIGFVNVVAGALGITALPGPATDCAWGGWMVWQPLIDSIRATTDVGFQGRFTRQYTIDSKAMRKFQEDESLAMVVENTSGAHNFEVALAGRMLVKAG